MNNNKIKKISIENLRGSINPFTLLFDKDKSITIIYGENGTGKTTICDAFEFIGKGAIASLDKKGLNKTKKYWPSVGKSNSDISVTLETSKAPITAKITKNEVIVTPRDTLPNIEVLRRNQILDLIAAQEAQRYEEIKRFIDVTEVEYSEATLKKAIDGLSIGRETAATRVQENKDAIIKFWEEDGKKISDPIKWAALESERKVDEFDEDIKAINNLINAHNRLKDYPLQLQVAQKNINTAEEALTSIKNQLTKNKSSKEEKERDIISLLEASRDYLHKHPKVDKCPLCESNEKIDDLMNRINKRLESFSVEIDNNYKILNAEKQVSSAKQKQSILEENAVKHINDFNDAIKGYKWPTDIKLPNVPIPKDIFHINEWIQQTQSFNETWDSSKTLRLDKKQFRNTLKNIYKMYCESYEYQLEIDQLIPKLTRIHDIMIEERKKFTDEVLTVIADEVGRIYELVHPGEGLCKISMVLDPNKRASLGINAEFCGISGNPPQAYFSESHLDTLGLCIFLALSGMEQPENTILILDDILASVDEPHVERIIEMLYSETEKFQHCIITTHYKPWKHKYRWGWLNNGQCHFVELGKWTKEEGIKLFRSVPDIERLNDLLKETSPDAQLVCAKASFILEAILDFITLLYECSTPRKLSGAYTLGELLPAISKKLKESLVVEVYKGDDSEGRKIYDTVKLSPLIEELTRIAQVRNVYGCHFNEISFDLLDSDAIGFSQLVYKLASVLVDSENGWPKNDKSGMYWSNKNETRRLLPLKKPS